MSKHNDDLYSNIELVPDDYLEKNPSAKISSSNGDDSHEHTHHHSHHSSGKGSVGKKEKKKKHKKKKIKKILISILIFLLSLILIFVIIFFIKRHNGKNKLLSSEPVNLSLPGDLDYDNIENGGDTIVYKGHTYKFNHNIASILFMGIDHDEFKDNAIPSTSGQADALYLMTYDTSTGRIKVLSLNRDTMTDINRYDVEGNFYDTAKKQLCLAYTFGDGKHLSAQNQVMAVSRLLYNIPINIYYAIDFSTLKILNDDLGGVTVTPEYTFASFKKGEKVTLLGETAEQFVRYRNTDMLDDNIRRMACQRQYLNAFAGRILPAIKNDLKLPVKLYQHTSKYTVTNLDTDIMVYLASALVSDYSGLNISSIAGKYVEVKDDTYAEFIVDKEVLFETVLDFYYTKVN